MIDWSNHPLYEIYLRLGHDRDGPAAYVVRCACDPGPNGDGGQTVVDHIRLFPVREDVRWTYAVHEQILPALRRANVPVRWTDVTVRHTGYTDPALRERKLQRDCKILEAELARPARTIRSCSSTWARLPSSGKTGRLPWAISSAAWAARPRPIRSCASSSP